MNTKNYFRIILVMGFLLSGCESAGKNKYFNNGEKKSVWIAPNYRETTQSHSEYEDIYIH
jgi:hypothetical protein